MSKMHQKRWMPLDPASYRHIYSISLTLYSLVRLYHSVGAYITYFNPSCKAASDHHISNTYKVRDIRSTSSLRIRLLRRWVLSVWSKSVAVAALHVGLYTLRRQNSFLQGIITRSIHYAAIVTHFSLSVRCNLLLFYAKLMQTSISNMRALKLIAV